MAEIRVRLDIPEKLRMSKIRADLRGGWQHTHGKSGVVLCGAGNGGAWVRFDGERGYVGVPIQYLVPPEK